MSGEREIPAEDSIKVVCRFRPLNDSEEKAGSKFIVKFPSDDNCISIAVSVSFIMHIKTIIDSFINTISVLFVYLACELKSRSLYRRKD